MAERLATSIRVGLLDSGVTGVGPAVAARAAFHLDNGAVRECPPDDADAAHGSALAETIVSRAPGIALVSAQVFRGGRPGAAAVVAAGLDWLAERGVQVVNMSFGLLRDRVVLRRACEAAIGRGIILVASTPASGGAVYPAAYPGVVRVTGDARCAPGELSWLGDDRIDFGACVGGPGHRPHHRGAGASLAAAHVSGELASVLARGASSAEAIDHLKRACRYHGRERRAGPPAGGPDPRP